MADPAAVEHHAVAEHRPVALLEQLADRVRESLADPKLGQVRSALSRLVDAFASENAQARSSGRFRLRQSREFVDLSYFQGPVGVAYTMLRLNDPSTPSILALETR